LPTRDDGQNMNRLRNSHPLVFLFTFWAGWGLYNLKLVSVVKLLDDLSLDAYPPLMLAQAALIFFSIKAIEWVAKKSSKWFYGIAGLFALLVSSTAVFPWAQHFAIFASPSFKMAVSCSYFLLSSLAVILVEMALKGIQSNNISLLKNPHISGQLCLSLELGIIAGALYTLVGNSLQMHDLDYITNAIPFAFMLFMFPVFRAEPVKTLVDKTSKESSKERDFLRYPFVPFLILLSIILLTSKHIQGLGVILGMLEIKTGGASQISVIFSKLNLAQTVAIIFGLIPSFFKQKSTYTWGRGVRIFLGLQAVSMGLLVFYSPAVMLIGTGIGRKLTQHLWLNKSIPILDSNIPYDVRFHVKKITEKYGQAISYVLIAIASAMVFYGPVPKMVLWLGGCALAVFGLLIRKRLLDTLNEFQVGNIVKSDLYEAVNACYSLANPESGKHYMALLNILKNKPRPMLAKAIIFSLGKMKEQRSVPYICDFYHKNDREDIQLVAVDALMNYPSHNVDLFFQRCLQGLITKQKSLGELRVSVFNSISSKIENVAILTLLDLLEVKKDDPLVVANTLILLGELAVKRQDEALFDILAKYLAPEYERRIRSNVIMYVYHSDKYRQAAQEGLDTFLTSNDLYDRTAVAFLAGNLKLRGLLPFVLENSLENEHQNSTLLISLLKMGHKQSAVWFADYLMNREENDVMTALNQLNFVPNQAQRFLVYFQILTRYSDRVGELLDALRRTKRNFDSDRQVIRSEAKRLGIKIEADHQIFVVESVPEVQYGLKLVMGSSQDTIRPSEDKNEKMAS